MGRAGCPSRERSACNVPPSADSRLPPVTSAGRPRRRSSSGPTTARTVKGASASRARSPNAAASAPRRACSASSGCPSRSTRTFAWVARRSRVSSIRPSVAGKRGPVTPCEIDRQRPRRVERGAARRQPDGDGPPADRRQARQLRRRRQGRALDLSLDLERRAEQRAPPGAVAEERAQRQRRGGRQGGGRRAGPRGNETQRERSVARALKIDRQVAQRPPRERQPVRAEVDLELRARGVAVGGDG